MIWGAGKNCKIVIDAIRMDMCNIVGIVDSNEDFHQKLYMNKWVIDSPKKLIDETIDYVIISAEYYSKEILQECGKLKIKCEKIIDYWNSDRRVDFIDINTKKIVELERDLRKYERKLKNIPYEFGLKPVPTIRPSKELLEIILKDGKSLSRFGDGELEIMQKRNHPWFQNIDEKLAERLKEVFSSKKENIIIALADNFGNLDNYTEEAADTIRAYLDNGIRESLMEIIDMDRVYYDAYVSRAYIIYKNKQHAEKIFELFKRIWKKRDILIVEGSRSYTGIRNDLFSEVSRIRRIIAPPQNAFLVYEEILSLIKENKSENMLVLISLGPMATVLAYDLAMEGIQALDIGQLDNEYEWYLRKATERIEIPGKCVAELERCHNVQTIENMEYEKQIIGKVGHI